MNKLKTHSIYILLLLLSLSVLACEDEKTNTLTVDTATITIPEEGGFQNITINTDASSWSIDNPATDWISTSVNEGTQNTALVVVNVNSKTTTERSATLTVNAGNAKPVKIAVWQGASDYLYEMSASQNTFTFKKSGSTEEIVLSTTAPAWTISADADWLSFEQTTGDAGTNRFDITAAANEGADERTATITVTADYTETITISVTQNGEKYPSYNTSRIPADASGMESTAEELAAKMKIGWNIGNTLEAIGSETAWGNPKVNKALIDLVKQSGFNAIRIPCAWDQYLADRSTARIKSDWLNRVREVVQYCVDNDMYVLLNIHWDGGWLEENCTEDRKDDNIAKQKAFWEQIATHLRDFDEHLLFASANEPHVENATEMAVLNAYHQTCIDAVRSTGGRNAYRTIVVQGPATDIDKTYNLMNTLPTDNTPDRMMVEVHFYSPWNFCGLEADASWGKAFYYWGEGYHSTTDTDHNPTYGEETDIVNLFQKMKVKFVDKGIPVLMGEYGAIRRSALTGDNLQLHLDSRAYYLKYVTQKMKEKGIIPFYWDNGHTGNNGFGIFTRSPLGVFDQQALDALIEGASK